MFLRRNWRLPITVVEENHKMFKSIFRVSFILIFALVSSVSYAGLDIDDRWGNIIAIYKFSDDNDDGPRGFDGQLQEGTEIVNGGRVKSLRLTGKGSFGSFLNDHHISLSNFSIVAWVKLAPQKDTLNIGMHGLTDDGDSVGSATLGIQPDGNLWGNFHEAASERSVEKNVVLQTEGKNVSDDKWHHIAFTRYERIYNIFIDGELATRRHLNDYLSVWGDKTSIYVTNANAQGSFSSRILVDELGFFESGFSVYEVRAIRSGIDAFIEAMPVEAKGKLATTWGDIKLR